MRMHHVRPYKFFGALEAAPSERIVQTALPYHRGAGGVTLLEMFLILAAARIVEARQVFEFGTYLGSTTLNLALNVPEEGAVFTLDLDERYASEAKQDLADAPLTATHLASKGALDFADSAAAKKIRMLTGDSTTFDFSPWHGSIDLAFIDGGHDLATVESDSNNALQMAGREKPSCVLWHDYGNRDYSGLTYWLDELSRKLDLVHIEDTRLCAWFNDPGKRIWPLLLST